MPTIESGQTTTIDLFAKFFHGLSNPTRFAIIEYLMEREYNVGELVALLKVSQGQVSNQLSCLRWCGYVSSRQEGKNVYYRITDERIRTIIDLGKQVVSDNADYISQCTRM